MSDQSSTVVLDVTPLVTTDAAALTSTIKARSLFQPAFIAQTPLDTVNQLDMPTGLTVAGDIWRILFALPSDMPAFVLYPYALTATLLCDPEDAAFPALFDSSFQVAFSINPLQSNLGTWQTSGMFGAQAGFGSVQRRFIDPNLRGFPIRPRVAAPNQLNRVGGLELTIATPDVSATANTSIEVDYRLLLFPEGVADNAGFYTPMLYYHPD